MQADKVWQSWASPISLQFKWDQLSISQSWGCPLNDQDLSASTPLCLENVAKDYITSADMHAWIRSLHTPQTLTSVLWGLWGLSLLHWNETTWNDPKRHLQQRSAAQPRWQKTARKSASMLPAFPECNDHPRRNEATNKLESQDLGAEQVRFWGLRLQFRKEHIVLISKSIWTLFELFLMHVILHTFANILWGCCTARSKVTFYQQPLPSVNKLLWAPRKLAAAWHSKGVRVVPSTDTMSSKNGMIWSTHWQRGHI